MRTFTIWQLLILSLAAQAAVVSAQTAAPAPQKLEQIEELGNSPITVTTEPNKEQSITQKREQGRVTEVKVTSGASSYFLRPNSPAGDATGSSNSARGPMWQIFEFGAGKTKQQDDDVENNNTPPPAMP